MSYLLNALSRPYPVSVSVEHQGLWDGESIWVSRDVPAVLTGEMFVERLDYRLRGLEENLHVGVVYVKLDRAWEADASHCDDSITSTVLNALRKTGTDIDFLASLDASEFIMAYSHSNVESLAHGQLDFIGNLKRDPMGTTIIESLAMSATLVTKGTTAQGAIKTLLSGMSPRNSAADRINQRIAGSRRRRRFSIDRSFSGPMAVSMH